MDTTTPPTTSSTTTSSTRIRHTTANLGVAVGVTAVVALVNGAGWAYWLIGAVYALALAFGVWCGAGPSMAQWSLRPAAHASAALVALLVGGAGWLLSGGENNMFWGVGVILGIVVSSSPEAWQRAR